MSANATFYIFKHSGKYYTHARGMMITKEAFVDFTTSTREELLKANGGKLPGLSSRGDDFVVTVIPDETISESFVGWPIHSVA